MKHFIVRWGLVLSMLLALVTVSAGATATQPSLPQTPTCSHTDAADHENWETLPAAVSGVTTLQAGKSYYLNESVTRGKVAVAAGAEVVLCLNSNTFTSSGSGTPMEIPAGASLTVCDCTKTGTYIFRGAATASAAAGFTVRSGGRLDVFDIFIKDSSGSHVLNVVSASAAPAKPSAVNFVNVAITNFTSKAGAYNPAIYAGQHSTVKMFDCEINGVTWNHYTNTPAFNSFGSHAVEGGVTADQYATVELVNTTVTNLTNNHSNANARLLGAVAARKNSTVNMFGKSSITGNIDAYQGGGVYVHTDATFNMYGGTISANTASIQGGGVYVNGGTFNMYGGEITGNCGQSSGGGGVYVQAGTFNLSGTGKISANRAENAAGSVGHGPAVRVASGATFNMTGGEISGHTRGNSGGGVYNLGTVTMSGGTIKDNTIVGQGGGVYNAAGATFTMGIAGGAMDGKITANQAGTTGGVYTLGTVIVNGGTIQGNTCKTASTSGRDVRAQGDAEVTFNGGIVGTAGVDACAYVISDTVGMMPVMTFNGGTFGGVNVSRGTSITSEHYKTSAATAQFNGGIFDRKYTAQNKGNAIVFAIGEGKEFLPYDDSQYIVATPAYKGANMEIGKSLDMNFYFKATAAAGATNATIYRSGASMITAEVTTDGDNLKVQVPGVAAKEMAKEIKVILRDADGEYVTSYADSIKAYGERVLNNSSKSDAHTVIIDMLNYGAAAQMYFDYNTDALANAGIASTSTTATATDGAALLAVAFGNNKDLSYSGSRAYHSANLTLDDQVDFNLYFWVGQIGDTKGYTYTDYRVNEQNELIENKGEFSDMLDGELLYQVKIEDLTVADLAKAKVTFNFQEKDESKTITDSVFNYLVRNNGKALDSQEENSDDSGLYAALMAFATSASAYASGDVVLGANGTPIL